MFRGHLVSSDWLIGDRTGISLDNLTEISRTSSTTIADLHFIAAWATRDWKCIINHPACYSLHDHDAFREGGIRLERLIALKTLCALSDMLL